MHRKHQIDSMIVDFWLGIYHWPGKRTSVADGNAEIELHRN